MSEILTPLHGGLILPGYKKSATCRPVVAMPLSDQLVIPLRQHIGEPARPIVAVGEKVQAGQCLGVGVGSMSAAVHTPAGGEVIALKTCVMAHLREESGICIVLATQPESTPFISSKNPRDPSIMEEQEVWQRIANAGIVGMGGAGFPTSEKLHFGMQGVIDTIILNAAECEPYISCDDMLLRSQAEEVVQGLNILIRLLDAEQAFIAMEEDKVEAYQALLTTLQKHSLDRVYLVRVPSRYPSGGEKQLIRILTGREVPSGSYPNDIGMYCQNVATAVAIYRAVVWGEPLVSRIVTVAGSGVAQPANVEVPVGTSMRELIEFCGGYTGNQPRLVVGGPMMGVGVVDDAAPVTKTTNCLLVVKQELAWREQTAQPCIRCGECAQVCPVRLQPQELLWHAQDQAMERLESYHLFDCIECGCCDYVCPSSIPLVQYFHCAKLEILRRNEMGIRAQRARQRFEAREKRLARVKCEQATKRRRRKEALQAKKTNLVH